MNLSILPLLAAIKYSTAAADADQITTLTCFDQSGYDLSESTTTEFKDGKYKINLSWSHVPDIVKCPGPPTPCLVQFDDDTIARSGLHSVSIDFICGHPGFGFMVPHYDVHWYLISEEERALMTCETGNYGPVGYYNFCAYPMHILCIFFVHISYALFTNISLCLYQLYSTYYQACNVPSEEYEQPTPEGAVSYQSILLYLLSSSTHFAHMIMICSTLLRHSLKWILK